MNEPPGGGDSPHRDSAAVLGDERMRITVSGRRADVPEALRDYVTSKASKLDRYYDRLHSVEIVFDQVAGDPFVEVIASGDHHNTFVAKEQHADAYAAADQALKELEGQLRRHKEKHRNRKHTGGRDDKQVLGETP